MPPLDWGRVSPTRSETLSDERLRFLARLLERENGPKVLAQAATIARPPGILSRCRVGSRVGRASGSPPERQSWVLKKVSCGLTWLSHSNGHHAS